MAALISPPGTDPVDRSVNGETVEVNAGWRNFFNTVFRLLVGLTMSGTTALRPTQYLYVGRPYFDTTLVLPIWWTGAAWIKADGTPA